MGRRLILDAELSPAQELVDAILTAQQRAIGDLALVLAQQVPGLAVIPGEPPELHGDEVAVVDALVREYAAVSGAIGPRLCFNAGQEVLARHPELHIPAFEGLEPAAAEVPAEGGGRKGWFRRGR